MGVCVAAGLGHRLVPVGLTGATVEDESIDVSGVAVRLVRYVGALAVAADGHGVTVDVVATPSRRVGVLGVGHGIGLPRPASHFGPRFGLRC